MKSLTRCTSGHYYDSEKHTACPFCGVQGLDVDIDKTRAKRTDAVEEGLDTTRPLQEPGGKSEEGKTIGIYRKRLGLEPVVGWLVAISGPEKGRDYRIISDKNFIGRSEKMDICIRGDETISRDNHAVITYNPKKQIFRLLPGDSKRLAYLNNEEVIEAEQLSPHDVIELGETRLLFVPLCGPEFHWQKDEAN